MNRRRRIATWLPATLVVLMAGSSAGAGPSAGSHPRVDGNLSDAAGMVEVEIRGRNGASPAAALAGRGAHSTVAVGDVVFTTVPATALRAIADHPSVAWVRPVSRPVVDALTGQGVAASGADAWQAFGVTGNGIEIAVVDAGFGGYTVLQAAGELPGSLTTKNYCGGGFESTDHGAGVAEIVHEMAPGAALHLICVDSGGDLAEAVDYASASGIDVITESLSWYPPGRGDGTGFLEPILEAAADAGIVWINSAGNQATSHWGGVFTDSDSDDWHDFSGTNDAGEENTFDLGSGESVYVILRWDDWSTSDNDYAVHLYRSDDTLLASTNSPGPDPLLTVQEQTGTQEPIDWFEYTSPMNQSVYVKIEKVSAAATPQMDLFVTLSGDDLENFTTSRSLTDPATSPLVVAAGAARWSTGTIESFSSRGPNIDGVLKPEIAGPDGVDGQTYGLFGQGDGFYGTSASAPHVAAAFALVLDAAPCLGATGTEALLGSLAEDRGPAGPDNTYGAGLLDLGDPATVADTSGCVLRRSGPNRYATAAAISAAQFPSGADTVFVATGLGFPDGLAGAAVAAKLGAPLLLTAITNLPPETASELNRLDPDTIVVLGGPGVIADTVLTDLGGYAPTVTRVFGNNRYDTAVAISQYGFPTPPAGTVFVATGLNFPDALAAGAAAAELGGTVLLVPGTSLPGSVAAELVRLDPATIVIVGGINAVSQSVFETIDALQGDDTVIRISGNDRYSTAVGLSSYAFPGGAAGAYVATGLNFPDALAGAAAAGDAGLPVLLVSGSAVPAVVQGEIDRLGADSLLVLGGLGAVSAAVERALEDGMA